MARRKKQLEMAKSRICRELVECEDRACNVQWEARFRRLKREFEETTVHSADFCTETLELIKELKLLIEKERPQMVEIYLSRLEGLAESVGQEERQESKMSFLVSQVKKIGSLLGGKKEDPEKELLRTQKEDTKQKIFQLQKRIVEFSEERSGLMAEFEQKIRECTQYPEDSYEYKIARQQAQNLRRRMSEAEKQIRLFADLLQKNEEYHSMLRSGETTFELRNYIPDTAEADLLMKKIAEETQDITADIHSFGKMVNTYGAMADTASQSDVFADDKEFDEMVQKQREGNQEPVLPETSPVPEADPQESKKTEKEWM